LWKPTHVSRQLHERFDPKYDINTVTSRMLQLSSR
jgi:hypothetical protein